MRLVFLVSTVNRQPGSTYGQTFRIPGLAKKVGFNSIGNHSIDSNIATRDFDKMNSNFKIPAAYGVLESSQVFPINKFFEFF